MIQFQYVAEQITDIAPAGHDLAAGAADRSRCGIRHLGRKFGWSTLGSPWRERRRVTRRVRPLRLVGRFTSGWTASARPSAAAECVCAAGSSGPVPRMGAVTTVTVSEALAASALDRLRSLTVDGGARFRPGQLEAIADVVVDRARVLCVQRTGWGKSAVYFVATGLLREAGAGPTLIISPLLALMRNQIAAAARLGLRAHTIKCRRRRPGAARGARRGADALLPRSSGQDLSAP